MAQAVAKWLHSVQILLEGSRRFSSHSYRFLSVPCVNETPESQKIEIRGIGAPPDVL
jgi:hypothetical protein